MVDQVGEVMEIRGPMPAVVALLRTNLVLEGSRQARLTSIGAVVPVIPPRARAVIDILTPLVNSKVCIAYRGVITTKLACGLPREVVEIIGRAWRAFVVADGGLEEAE